MSSTNSTHVPVLIIGGGIVGLSASLFLSDQGIQSMLIERHSGTSIHPRARSVNTRTMEIYRGIGISDLVRDAGASMSFTGGIYSGTSLKSVIESNPRAEKRGMPSFIGTILETGPENGLFVTQDMTEPVLLKAAKERGGDVRFSTDCLGVEQDQGKVTAHLQDRGSSDRFTVTADYLIAADGANSPIRSKLGVPITGRGTLGYMLNILFHADLKDLVEKREFSLCIVDRPEVLGLFASINNSDRWVFQLSYDPSKGEKPEDFPPEKCKELLRIALGIPDIEIEVKSILPWEPSVRVATKLQHGRIFLAGDAAHQMPPWAGQGANSGISDVHNLSWKLAAVLQRQADPKLLETYDIERQPVGKAAAEASAAAADERGLICVTKSFKNAGALVKRLPLMSGFGYIYSCESIAVREESTCPLGGVTWKTWNIPSVVLSLDGRPGTRAPHVWVEKNGKRISTVDLFGKGFTLLTGSDGGPWLAASQEVNKSLDGMKLASYCVGLKGEIVDKEMGWARRSGISSTGALLVRPDGFVAWRQRRMPADVQKSLEETMRSILGL